MARVPINHDTAGRRARLRAELRTADDPVSFLVVSDLVNVRYLTGFTGSNAAVLIDVDDPAAEIDELRWQPIDDGSLTATPDLAPLLTDAVFPALTR